MQFLSWPVQRVYKPVCTRMRFAIQMPLLKCQIMAVLAVHTAITASASWTVCRSSSSGYKQHAWPLCALTNYIYLFTYCIYVVLPSDGSRSFAIVLSVRGLIRCRCLPACLPASEPASQPAQPACSRQRLSMSSLSTNEHNTNGNVLHGWRYKASELCGGRRHVTRPDNRRRVIVVHGRRFSVSSNCS